MAFSKKDEYQALFDQLYQSGFVLHRSDDFHQKVELFLLDHVPISDLGAAIESNIPHAFPMNVLVPVNGSLAYIFLDRWKAVLEVFPVNAEICSYRFRFAEPSVNIKSIKHMDSLIEMNIAATAVEKTFLKLNKASHVIMAYATAKDRQFEIGPSSPQGSIPDLTKLENLTSLEGIALLAMGAATGFVTETSTEVIKDYLIERKNSNKLGSEAASDLLASRFLKTPACPEEVQNHFDDVSAKRHATRYCRKCGSRITKGNQFCVVCGTQIASPAPNTSSTGYNASVFE